MFFQQTAATTGSRQESLRARLKIVVCYLQMLSSFYTTEEAVCFWEIHAKSKGNILALPLYLACADVFPQAVLSDSDLQVRVVLPCVSVRGVFPAAGPG